MVNSRLELTPEEMRSLGYQVIDMLVEHFEQVREQPVTNRATRAEMEQRLREPPPQQGSTVGDVLQQVQRDVLGNSMHIDHPRFLAFVPSSGNFVGAVADALVSGFNIFAGTWLEAAGPTEI